MANTTLPQGVAVVTGAAGGMGSACARQLADAGWNSFLLCDVSAERLEAVPKPLREVGNAVTILAGNIADPAFPAKVMDALKGEPIAALIHTAGIAPMNHEPLRILSVNLDATIRVVSYAKG